MSDSSSDSAHTAGSQNGGHVTTRRVMKKRASQQKDDTEGESPAGRRPSYKLKVPPFSPEDPELWFALLEGQFENCGITDDAIKFTQVTLNIDLVHAKEIKDIIVKPPARKRYEKIKTELIRRLSASHEKKVRQLLTHEELGDRKPSQFLRHLQDLAGPSVPADFIKTIWCQRLPSHVQTVLASQATLLPEQLADLADNIMDIVTPSNVAATSCSTPGSGPSSEIAELKKMVEKLALKVEESSRATRRYDDRSRPRQHSSSRYRSRSGPRSRSNSNYRKHPMCWYHFKFGDKAQRCVKPCDHAGKV